VVNGVRDVHASRKPQLAGIVVADQHELPDGSPSHRPVSSMGRVCLLRRWLPPRRVMLGRAVWHDVLRSQSVTALNVASCYRFPVRLDEQVEDDLSRAVTESDGPLFGIENQYDNERITVIYTNAHNSQPKITSMRRRQLQSNPR
jgi:hypothetical protein